jgi:tetratricopeptide (TPR) repeat protein
VNSVTKRPHLRRILAALPSAAALAIFCFEAEAAEAPSGASTVIGANAMLSDGAQAMMSGDWERGVQLTQLGLHETISESDRASAHANLCAGYTALKNYERALENCNQSIALFDGNWRAWQNRAAAYLGLGKIEESIRDIQRGLQLNPDSEDLQKTLAIAREYEKLRQERMRRLVES